MKKLRVAVIGTGGIAQNQHLPSYERIDNIEVVAVCDINKERVEMVAEKYNVPKHCTDYKEILEMKDVDAVDICTPNYLHSIIACEALEKGFNVLCEKPDAVSVVEAEKMQAAAQKSGKCLMVIRNNRFWGTSNFLKKFIDDGKMGEIYAARCGWQRRRGIPGRGGWFTTKEQSGGGPLIDLGVHMIDLAIWLMGNPTPVAVSGCTYNKFANSEDISDSVESKFGDRNAEEGIFDVEDLAMGFIKFDNGACMQIEFSWASNIEKENYFVELRGEKAGSTWCSLDQKLKIFGEDYGTTTDFIPNINNPKGMPCHEANIRHFADVVLNGTEPIFVSTQGVDMIKILEAMYKSAESGKEIRL